MLLWNEELGEQPSVDALIQRLQDSYKTKNQTAVYRSQLMARRQGQQESLENYLREVQRLTLLAFPGKPTPDSESVSVQILIAGLSNRRLAMRLMEMETITLQATIQFATKLDAFETVERGRSEEINRHPPKFQTVRGVYSQPSVRDMDRRVWELEKGRGNVNPTAHRNARHSQYSSNNSYHPSSRANRQPSVSSFPPQCHNQPINDYKGPTDAMSITREPMNCAWNYPPPPLQRPLQSFNASSCEGADSRSQPSNYQRNSGYSYPPLGNSELRGPLNDMYWSPPLTVNGMYFPPPPPPTACLSVAPVNSGYQPLQTIDNLYIPPPLPPPETYPSPPLHVARLRPVENRPATANHIAPAKKRRKSKGKKRRKQRSGEENNCRFDAIKVETDFSQDDDWQLIDQVSRIREERSGGFYLLEESDSESTSTPPLNGTSSFDDGISLKLMVHNEEVDATVDSGTYFSLCEPELISKRLWKSADRRLFALGGSEIEIIAKATLKFRIGENWFEADYVSPSVSGILLGANFLRENRAVWDFEQQRIQLDGCWFKLGQQSSVASRCARVVVMKTMAPLRKKAVPTCVPDAFVKSAAVSPAVFPNPWEDDTETLFSEPTTTVNSVSESENVFSSSPAVGRKGCCVTVKHNKPKKSYWIKHSPVLS